MNPVLKVIVAGCLGGAFAAAMAQGRLTLHGWFFEIETQRVLALDGSTGIFVEVNADGEMPVAMVGGRRLADSDRQNRVAAA